MDDVEDDGRDDDDDSNWIWKVLVQYRCWKSLPGGGSG